MSPVETASIDCMIVPTGIGASIGGFAGDANPVCKMLAAQSRYLITHPNVVNAAILTDIPPNVVVVEGALLDMFFEGKIELVPNVQHKIAVVLDSSVSQRQQEITTNVMNACRHTYGLDIMSEIFYTDTAIGADAASLVIANEQTLLDACARAIEAGATAIALLAKIEDLDDDLSQAYAAGRGFDPMGKIEAKLSHLVTSKFLIPAAHAPILQPEFEHEGVVHPRVAAEHIGLSFLPSVIKCLERSAAIVSIGEGEISVNDVSRLIVPWDACDGVPMREAERQGVELVCVRENTTVLDDTAELLNLKYVAMDSYQELCVQNAPLQNFVV